MAKKRSTGFGQRLRDLREQAGLTQAGLAEKAGLHVMGLAKIEHGSREPAWGTALILARALGVSVADFVTNDFDHPPALSDVISPRPRGRPPKAQAEEQGEVKPVVEKKPRKRKGG